MAIKKPELSIIIVNYKNQELVLNCIQSILLFEKELDFEIIVIDNYSNDDSERKLKEIYPRLRWFQMGYNSGFGRANNFGLKQAKGENILLLNSDVFVRSLNSINACLKYLKNLPNSDNNILGAKLENEDGSYQETLRFSYPGLEREIKANPLYIFIINRIFKVGNREKLIQKEAHLTSGAVKWINAAFWMFKKETFKKKIFGFDEDFFLYGEDMELAWRLSKAGIKFYHFHEQEFVHIGSASMPDNALKRCQVIVSDWLFYKKSKGIIFLSLILCQVFVNLVFDQVLYVFAKLRKRTFSSVEIRENRFREVYFYLLFKYGLRILFFNKLSSEKSFKTNCYEDTFLAQKIK